MRSRPKRTSIFCATLGSCLLLASACGTAGGDPAPIRNSTSSARLYGADGNMSNSFGERFKDQPGALLGMKGTTPLTKLPQEFKKRLREVDPQLIDFAYAGEAYDAAAIAAIAAAYAKSTEPQTIANHLVGITTGGQICDTVAACLALARDGKDLQYRGVSLRHSGLNDAGEPSSATYATVSFAKDNQLDESRTEYIGAGDAAGQSAVPGPDPGRAVRYTGPLRIGSLLPKTGRLAIAGPPMFAGLRLAIRDVNAAGGVLDDSVYWIDGDDGTSPQVAQAAAVRMINQGVQVIVGAGSSSVTKAVLPTVVGAGRVLISPSATSDELTALDDTGLFFRTAPSDHLQAKALADMIMRDGSRRIGIVAIDDPYGVGLQENVKQNLIAAGIAESDVRYAKYPVKDSYDLNSDLDSIFGPIGDDLKAFGPDAILVIGFDESALAIQALRQRDMLPTE